MLKLPTRLSKPRTSGITAVHDVRENIGALKNILADYSSYIDIAKLGVGSAYVTPKLQVKIDLYKSHDIEVYFGGTLFEKFYYQKKLKEYKQYMKDHNVSWVEISMGTIDIALEERVDLVKEFNEDFTVLSEIGSKDGEAIMPPSVWINELNTLLEAGCEYVITEGRNSGTAGVYRPSGEIRTGLVADIVSNVPSEKIIFEAPQPKAQMFFINQVGANVNLGNVNPNDLLLLEAQRSGLRSETFFLK